jgi:hypothetical protein
MYKNFTFIHIGKCGGSTITTFLKENNFNFNGIHVQRVRYKPDIKYLIVLRNPVDRFISSFYWRKYLLESNKQQNPDELKFLQKYESVDNLCNNLYTKNGDLNSSTDDEINYKYGNTGQPEHYAMGLDYYIGDFVKKYNPRNIIGIICTETLNHDLERIFGIGCNINKKNNEAHKAHVSKRSKLILKKYLHKDYVVIENLNDSNLLSENQYKILSK